VSSSSSGSSRRIDVQNGTIRLCQGKQEESEHPPEKAPRAVKIASRHRLSAFLLISSRRDAFLGSREHQTQAQRGEEKTHAENLDLVEQKLLGKKDRERGPCRTMGFAG